MRQSDTVVFRGADPFGNDIIVYVSSMDHYTGITNWMPMSAREYSKAISAFPDNVVEIELTLFAYHLSYGSFRSVYSVIPGVSCGGPNYYAHASFVSEFLFGGGMFITPAFVENAKSDLWRHMHTDPKTKELLWRLFTTIETGMWPTGPVFPPNRENAEIFEMINKLSLHQQFYLREKLVKEFDFSAATHHIISTIHKERTGDEFRT